MAQQYAHFSASADASCFAYLAGDGLECVMLLADVDITWATAGGATLPEKTQVWDVIGGTVNLATLHRTWLLVVTTGGDSTHPVLSVEERFFPTLAATLAGGGASGDYAIWGRVVDGRVESYQQGM